MNMQDLYDHMKNSLNMFGVRFANMQEVSVTAEDGILRFHHEATIISQQLPSEPEE